LNTTPENKIAIATEAEPTAVPVQFSESDSGSGAFASFLQFLRKRVWLILLTALATLAAAIVLDLVVPPYYKSLAQIEIVPDMSPEFRLEQIQSMMSNGSGDEGEKLDTEIQIMQSRTLALQTIQALKLDDNQTFLPFKHGRRWNLNDPLERFTVLKAFNDDLDVKRFGHTDIIQVNVTTHSPALSALIANTLVDEYIQRSFRANFEATRRISGWLDTQLNDLRKNLENSQAQMISYQKDLGLVGLTLFSKSTGATNEGTDTLTTSLNEMIKQSAEAGVDRMMKEALYNAIQTSSPGVVDSLASAVNPELLTSRTAMLALQNQYASMSKTYGSAYPPLQNLQNQIDELNKKIAAQEGDTISSAQKQFEAARAYESQVNGVLNKQKEDAFGKGEQVSKLQFAIEDYEANRLLYDGLQVRLQESSILSGLKATSIEIVDNADVPAKPWFPRNSINLPVGLGVGLLLGFGLALVREGMDVNLKTISEIEQGLNLPLLGTIPMVKPEEIAPVTFRKQAVPSGGMSWSRIAESMRGMRTSILLSSPGSPPKVLQICSSRPAEGKSSMASLFGITLALGGAKVLLIDADLRRPRVHLSFRLGKRVGLSSVLSGKSTLQEAIVQWEEMPNLHILPAGPTPPMPSELLGAKQMEDSLSSLRTEYDFIIIDTPPVLAVTDAAVICRITDAAILVVRYGIVQRHVAQRTIDLLGRAGAHLLGVVINAVDFGSPEYSEYYGRKYSDYYGELPSE
jgi:capsular exopolysaccharide synthesis family protein